MAKKIFLMSLGCPRNLVDSERLLGILEDKGFQIIENIEEANIAIVNTCGFIQDAKEESISYILQIVELKKEKKIDKIIVVGCLTQRYPEEFSKEIKEIDAIFGVINNENINRILDFLSKKTTDKNLDNIDYNKRKILTLPHSVYIKIQEGCSNRCSYCIIPQLKGKCKSKTIEDIINEINIIKKTKSVKEIILIGQDTTSFGYDRNNKNDLINLLNLISPLIKDKWIKLLYTHPAHFTKELINVIKNQENICKYIDLPIQHINNRILKKMNRLITKEQIIDLINDIRKKIKNVAIRTSIIVGFPGETEEEFNELLCFLEQIKFERLGVFLYSCEEGTIAYNFKDQVSEKVKKQRFEKIMQLQQKISYDNNGKFINKTIKVLVEEKNGDLYVGRSEIDAPEVDGVVYIKGNNLKIGDFVNVKITDFMEYDLYGEIK